VEEATVTILNSLGIHVRPAALIVQVSSKFQSEVKLVKNGVEVNGKSIMGVMMLAAGQGSQLTIIAQGKDEKEAVAALAELVRAKFNEE
jgi:phosphocarrier protein HPr